MWFKEYIFCMFAGRLNQTKFTSNYLNQFSELLLQTHSSHWKKTWMNGLILWKLKARNQNVYTHLKTLRMWHSFFRKSRLLWIKCHYYYFLNNLSYFAVRYLRTCVMFNGMRCVFSPNDFFVIYVPKISGIFYNYSYGHWLWCSHFYMPEHGL